MFLGGEVSTIRLSQPFPDLFNLPLVGCDVLADGLGCDERPAAALRLGQIIKLLPQFRFQRSVMTVLASIGFPREYK